MKVLIYCTMAKPYLMPFWKEKETIGYMLSTEFSEDEDEVYSMKYNGSVCFECDCKEAKQLYIYESESPDDEFHSFGNCDFVKENFRRMGLSGDAESTGNILDKYGNYWLYFYHFENVKPIDPMPITKLYKDEWCNHPLTKAPQSYCFAYRKIYVHLFIDGNRELSVNELAHVYQDNVGLFNKEKVLVFSIRSPWVCKIANGNKDLEVRKTRIANAGIEYK